MSYSHTNKIVYSYTAGGADLTKTVSKTETSGAEINISEAVTTDSSSETAAIDLSYFEFELAAKAVSVYLRIDGFNCELKGGVAGASSMANLDDGEPYVWSYNGSSDFPAGNTNPMVNATDMLKIIPDAGAGTDTAGTLTVKVLYDPS